MMKDLFGQAILDYQLNGKAQPIITETTISEADELYVEYLFRTYNEMPKIEKKALDMAKGRVLDVGCGAGSHSIYLQEKGLEVVSIDVSPQAVEACKIRGVKNVVCTDLLSLNDEEKFDTILILMNGTGIFQKLKKISEYLTKLKSLLNPAGQILIDSTDLIYMFDEDEKQEVITNAKYYGEVEYFVEYKGEKETFDWLYMDFDTLEDACEINHLNCEMIMEGENFDYLARLY